jgi:hypothetical protein
MYLGVLTNNLTLNACFFNAISLGKGECFATCTSPTYVPSPVLYLRIAKGHSQSDFLNIIQNIFFKTAYRAVRNLADGSCFFIISCYYLMLHLITGCAIKTCDTDCRDRACPVSTAGRCNPEESVPVLPAGAGNLITAGKTRAMPFYNDYEFIIYSINLKNRNNYDTCKAFVISANRRRSGRRSGFEKEVLKTNKTSADAQRISAGFL